MKGFTVDMFDDVTFPTEICLREEAIQHGPLSANRQGGFLRVTPTFPIALSTILNIVRYQTKVQRNNCSIERLYIFKATSVL
jgi:hypothetical protein